MSEQDIFAVMSLDSEIKKHERKLSKATDDSTKENEKRIIKALNMSRDELVERNDSS